MAVEQVPPITIQYGLLQLPEGATHIKVTQWAIDFPMPYDAGVITYNITLIRDDFFCLAYSERGKTSTVCYCSSIDMALDQSSLHYNKMLADLAECG